MLGVVLSYSGYFSGGKNGEKINIIYTYKSLSMLGVVLCIVGIFRGIIFLWIWKILRVRGKNFVVTCTRALMSVARCIYGNCLVGKYFVVCFLTTKFPPPRKIPAIW